ncbi:MAG TPA: PrsW family glutamic-type intramembrane protease, partial [Anaerolineales bacterium]
ESPAQGFSLGALSGAGYGLIETIGISAQAPGDWAGLLFSRIGTGLLHITTSALVGAAIVVAWRERRYARLLGVYLFAVLLNGLWNMLAMLFSFSELAELLKQAGWLQTIQPTLITALGMLAVALFVILIISNRHMRKSISTPAVETKIAADSTDQTS